MQPGNRLHFDITTRDFCYLCKADRPLPEEPCEFASLQTFAAQSSGERFGWRCRHRSSPAAFGRRGPPFARTEPA